MQASRLVSKGGAPDEKMSDTEEATVEMSPIEDDIRLSKPHAETSDGEEVSASTGDIVVWGDFIRSVAIFLVVLGNCADDTRFLHLRSMSFLSAFSSIVYTAVHEVGTPLLFMLSGYFMLHKSESLETLYRRRVPRIVEPLIFWTLLYTIYRRLVKHEHMTFTSFFAVVVQDYGSEHLWYLYALLGCYLVTPFLQAAVRHSEPRVTLSVVLIWVFTDSVLVSCRAFFNFRPPILELMQFPQAFVGYYLAGALARHYPVISKRTATICGVLVMLAFVGIVEGTTRMTRQKGGNHYDKYLEQDGAWVVMLTLPVFALLRMVGQSPRFLQSPRLVGWSRELADNAYGIYLCHPLIQDLYRPILGGPGWNAIMRIPLQTVIVFFSSYMLVNVWKRLPVIRRAIT
eukprot:TRINITY_DN4736_c0_g1_i1.p1 TRINITY_DN4736_c0_g1~~TRINITY_DN4736_c0_g1_i1.p1  ORF type:complete len:400 (+),score=128.14 TRINITY_DN4736_c0_g1_i1:101-1300(+)